MRANVDDGRLWANGEDGMEDGWFFLFGVKLFFKI